MTDKKKTDKPAPVEEQTTAVTEYAGYDEFAGKGFQNQTREDIAIPFINVLQSNSPEVAGDAPLTDAKAGQLVNSVTQELHELITFVPAITQHVFVEWIPRDDGGGLVGQHELHSDAVKAAKAVSSKFGNYKHGDNDLVETFYIFGVLCNGTSPVGMAVMAFTATKIKSYKAIMGRLNGFQLDLAEGQRVTPPLFAHLLEVTTKKESNKKGSYFVPSVQPAVENSVEKSLLKTTDPRFLMAAECERLVNEGVAYADTSTINNETAAAEEEDGDLF